MRLSDQPNNRGIKFGQGLHHLEIRATAVFQVGRLPRYIPTISHRIHLLVYGIFPDIYHGFPGTFLEKSIPFPRKTWRTSRSLPSTAPRWSSTLAVGIWSGILRVHKTLEGSCDLNRGGGDDLHTVEPGGTMYIAESLKKINMYIPGTQMILVLIGKDLLLEAKQRTNRFQVYIYIYAYLGILPQDAIVATRMALTFSIPK